MNLPDGVQTVVLKPNDFQLLGVAAFLLIVFVIGFVLAVANGQFAQACMLAAIFGCLTVQGMRK
jgi:hypothetical protein